MLRIFRTHRWPGVTRGALVAPDLNWYLARWGCYWWLVRFLTCSTLCQLGNPATDALPSRQAAHQAQKRVFLHFSSTNKLGGNFGEPSFSSFFFRCYPNFVTRSSWRGRGALERVVTAQKLLNQITASTGVNLWIITFLISSRQDPRDGGKITGGVSNAGPDGRFGWNSDRSGNI